MTNKEGILPGWPLAAPIAPLACHYLGKGACHEVEVAFDRQPQWAGSAFQLREHEVGPFVVQPADESEETEVAVFFGTFLYC